MLPQTIISTFKKFEGRGNETQLKMMMATKWWLFSQLQYKLFYGNPILRFVAAPFVFIVVVLSSLATLFALFRV